MGDHAVVVGLPVVILIDPRCVSRPPINWLSFAALGVLISKFNFAFMRRVPSHFALHLSHSSPPPFARSTSCCAVRIRN